MKSQSHDTVLLTLDFFMKQYPKPLKGIVSRKFDILFVGIIRQLGSFYTFFLFYPFFKIWSFSCRIFEYSTFSGEYLLSHKTVNELCYVAGFVNRIVTS
jgi:hypothetical protein